MEHKSDKELLLAMRSGDEYPFQCIFNRHWRPLYAYVYKLINDEDQAKDILQNAFLTVWDKRAVLIIENSVMPYLANVAKNEVMTLFRKNKVRLAGEDIIIKDLQRVNHPEELMIAGELQSAIDSALIKMPSNMRQCFQLSRYEQRSIQSIAKELTLSEQTVKNNIAEARRRLKNTLTSNQFNYPVALLLAVLNLTQT
jgi:RNA polymerase sigma factor (sigma-70 family)